MNIISNLKEYMLDILSVIILSISFFYLFNNAYYNPLLAYNNTIKTLSMSYQQDEIKLNAQLYNDEKKDETNNNDLDTIPQLLTRINDTCKAPNVIIRTLKPKVDNPFAFELKFISNYFDFLKVLSEFEKLNIVINKIDIKPYEIANTKSKHLVTIDLEAINGGEKLSLDNVSFLEYELKRNNKRDPFQRFAKIGKEIQRLVDLTWIYKLSGIGKIDGKFVATIDHRVYYENSKLNGMTINTISPKGLTLSKKTFNGTKRFVLNFRKKEKANNEEK
jgi:hypothetical protein